jgi:hypothetical protein
LLAAGLLFWGWFGNHLVPAAVMALLLEATRLHAVRWRLGARDFERIADLCTVAFAAVLVYRFVESRHFPDSLLTVLVWLPFLFFLLIAAQRYSSSGEVPLSALFWSLRRGGSGNRPSLALDHAYFCLCLLAGSAANPRTPWFFTGVCALGGYVLWAVAPRGRGRVLWAAVLACALLTGFGLQAALFRLQGKIEEWALEYLAARWSEADPYLARTAIGDIGSLKLSDGIVMRVDTHGQPAPQRLVHAAYDVYFNGTWTAAARAFSMVQPEGGAWPFAAGNGRSLRLSVWLKEGRALLALPHGTYRLTSLNVGRAERNALGAVRVTEGPDMLLFDAWYDPAAAVEAPPGPIDLQIPPSLAGTLESVATDLGLKGQPPARAARTIARFFSEQFAYSLVLSGANGQPRGLSQFLLEDRRGHCEYFATATALLLRYAGVPARYATGYAVQEYSTLEGQHIVRARHAHAWALMWIDGRWQELDTTPAVWAIEEAKAASPLQPLYDLASWLHYLASRWRASPGEPKPQTVRWVWLSLPLALFLAWQLYRRQRVRRSEPVRPPHGPGTDPRVLAVLAALAQRGYVRPPGAPLLSWVAQLPLEPPGLRDSLRRFVRDYYRLRFDPSAPDPQLDSVVSQWASQLQMQLKQ